MQRVNSEDQKVRFESKSRFTIDESPLTTPSDTAPSLNSSAHFAMNELSIGCETKKGRFTVNETANTSNTSHVIQSEDMLGDMNEEKRKELRPSRFTITSEEPAVTMRKSRFIETEYGRILYLEFFINFEFLQVIR